MHLNQLPRKMLYTIKSGSHLYGLNTPESDIDYLSIFLPRSEDLLSLQKCEYVDNSTKNSSENRRNTNEDIDDHQYSLQRYLHLVLSGNPNLTEVLFAPKNVVIVEDERFTFLKNNYDKLISSNVYNSFVGFSYSQRKKLEYKSKRFGQLAKSIYYLESVFTKDQLQDSKLQLGEKVAEWLNINLNEYKGDKNNIEHFNKGLPLKTIYTKIVSEYERYGWRVHTKEFEKLGYDGKFAYHTIRLLYEGEQLLLNGKIEYPIEGQVKDDIFAIRKGEVPINDFYTLCTMYEDRCRLALEKSKLPKNPKRDWVNKWLINTLKTSIIEGEI